MSDDWFDGGGSGSPCDVAAILDCDGWAGLVECVALGALVALGTTRDGGALGITVTVDGRWRRQYFREGGELTSWVAEALPAVRSAVGATPPASSARPTRPRRSKGL
jgi:hypothetical protein